MTTFSAVSSTAERLDCLLLADGAQARCEGNLRDTIVQLRSEIDLIEIKLVAVEHGNNKISQDAKKKITQLAYDIEGSVESYARDSRRKLGGGLFQCVFKARSLRKDIHTFRRRIDKLKKINITRNSNTNSNSLSAAVEPPPPPPQSADNEVGLMKLLLGDESKFSVVALCGIGGMGKTTLAQSVYNNPLVSEHFDISTWASVGNSFQASGILEGILSSLVPAHELSGMQLVEQLFKILKGRRYLLVLDGLSYSEDWDAIRSAFRNDNNGSRIVITTPSMDMAHRLTTNVLQMQRLNEDESWELFKLRSGLLDDPGMQVNPDIETIGRTIASYCGGLPLALTVIGSTLRMKNLENLKEMSSILSGDLNLQDRESALSLSYNHLPLHLKPCFLYLGNFPKDEDIPVEKLYLLWMAEGLISTRALNNRTQMEVAEVYLSQLVDRGLVSVVNNGVSAPTRFISCHLHDVLHDLCISKGKQEDFVQVIDFRHQDKIRSSSRRLAIYLNEFEGTNNDVLLNIRNARHIRTMLFYDKDDESVTWTRKVPGLTEFQGTRVLDFDGVDFRVKKLPRGIHKLIYLRHLSFQGCYLHVFPSSFSNFPFLETLDLRVRVSCLMAIPNVLWKISSLRHLYFPLAFRVDTNDKLKLYTLKKLQVLENFNGELCDANDLLQLEKLQILTGVVQSNTDLKNIISCMNSNKFLRHSSLEVKYFYSGSKERRSIVASLLECNSLQNLDFEGYLGVIPRHGSNSFGNFTSMVFNGSKFSEDPMPMLGKFPNLRSLVLCKDAFVGKKLVCSEPDHFLRLESLKLATLWYLEQWEVEEASMPSLTSITIERCNKLEALPIGLSKIPTLQTLVIGSMPGEFQDKVKKMIQGQQHLDNQKLLVSFY
ncbi:hypothetical protein ACP275_03G001000 [Erythranthe tilingii]